MKANEFDTRFDNGEDITDFLDFSQVKHLRCERQSINVDFPIWMIEALDQEAKRLGVTPQAIIKIWIGDRLSNLTG